MSLQKETTNFGEIKPVFNCPKTVNLTSSSASKTDSKFEVLPNPVKSESDKKEYKVIKLENGMVACLIADKEPFNKEHLCDRMSEDDGSSSEDYFSGSEGTDDSMTEVYKTCASVVEQKMAAAGLCVGVGSFSDPKEVPGMAHFLEHMVFMGSKKFPPENDFDSFIKRGGGNDNASTETERTCFYFECLEKHLYQALDKFSQFFISPLMHKGAMTREREAIDSEFQIAVPSDSSRKEQLLCSFAQPHSPVNSFSWGNLITLRDNVSDDALYSGVHKFRKRHYSAHRMTLAIQARLPMEVLESYVLECFADVPNNGLPSKDFTKYAEGIFDTPDFTRLYYIKPIKDLCQVDLTWSFPSLHDKYKSKPHQYIAHLLGDEGKGSLLSYLRKRVWGLATSIGNGEAGLEQNSMYTLFTVTVILTAEGLAHLDEVIEVIFSYINMLKQMEPQERVFQEMKTISDTSFRFSSEETAVDLVEEFSEAMQIYPPQDYITGPEIYFEYDPEAIKMLTNLLQPNKMNIMVIAKSLPVDLKYDKVEKWFGTEYTSQGIPEEWIKKWQSVEPFSELAIPPPNPYLTTDFSILPVIENHPDFPQKVVNSELHEMWYRRDQKFKLPSAYYNFYLINSKSIESASSSVMLDVVINFLVIAITEEVYPATSADLNHNFVSHERGLVIRVSGYNEKLPVLIEVISKYLITLNDHITEDMFTAVKDKIIKSYYNKLLKPSSLAKDVRLNLLVDNYWTPAEKYSALLDITFHNVKQFSQDFIKSLYVKSLVQGNVSLDVAVATVNKFVNSLHYVPLTDNSYPKFRVIQVPLGEKCCRIQGLNETDSNSLITNYYQCGPFSMRTSIIIEIIMLIIEEPLFDILRTKEQLGYHVYCSIRDTFGILGYTLTVNTQATKHSTSYVDSRIEQFLKHTQKLLADTTEKELNLTKEDIIKTKQCLDVDLKDEVVRNWSEITSDDYLFDRLKQEIDIIGSIKIEEIRDWWSSHNVFGSKSNFRKLSIQVVGHDKNEKITTNNISSGSDLSLELFREPDANKMKPPTPKEGSDLSLDLFHEPETNMRKLQNAKDPVPSGKLRIKLLGNMQACEEENRPIDYFVNNIEKFKRNLYLYPAIHPN